jgi:peroxiredoxin
MAGSNEYRSGQTVKDNSVTLSAQPAPEWSVSQWFNTKEPRSLSSLRGKVIVIEAFQMLCPGCVAHGLPQAQRVAQIFDKKDVQVIGMHCVFEHHEAQSPLSLAAFLHEYRIQFPVGVDAASASGGIPATMERYAMRGTPTLILIDRSGRMREQMFGQIDDIALGARVMALISEPADRCDEIGCSVPPN